MKLNIDLLNICTQVKIPSNVRVKINGELGKADKRTDKNKVEFQEELGGIDIFKNSECRKATLAMFIIWMSVSLSKC